MFFLFIFFHDQTLTSNFKTTNRFLGDSSDASSINISHITRVQCEACYAAHWRSGGSALRSLATKAASASDWGSCLIIGNASPSRTVTSSLAPHLWTALAYGRSMVLRSGYLVDILVHSSTVPWYILMLLDPCKVASLPSLSASRAQTDT